MPARNGSSGAASLDSSCSSFTWAPATTTRVDSPVTTSITRTHNVELALIIFSPQWCTQSTRNPNAKYVGAGKFYVRQRPRALPWQGRACPKNDSRQCTDSVLSQNGHSQGCRGGNSEAVQDCAIVIARGKSQQSLSRPHTSVRFALKLTW